MAELSEAKLEVSRERGGLVLFWCFFRWVLGGFWMGFGWVFIGLDRFVF